MNKHCFFLFFLKQNAELQSEYLEEGWTGGCDEEPQITAQKPFMEVE